MIRSLSLLLFFSFLANCACAKTVFVCQNYLYQGRSLPVKAYSDVPIKSIQASFLNNEVPFFRMSEYYRGYLSTLPEQAPGRYIFSAKVIFQNGSTESFSKSVWVKHKWFPKVAFWVKPSKKKLMRRDLIAEEWEEVERSFRKTPQKLWEDKFIRPVNSVTTMAYGVREYVNGRPSGRHRGWDFRAATGTPIKSPNHGTIVFCKHLEAFGGTMVIDHGLGVHTLFFHLSEFLKPVGSQVKKGETVALSGNSGISSGPHLHWGLSVSDVRVDPAQWVTYRM